MKTLKERKEDFMAAVVVSAVGNPHLVPENSPEQIWAYAEALWRQSPMAKEQG